MCVGVNSLKMLLILIHFWWKAMQTTGSDNFSADSFANTSRLRNTIECLCTILASINSSFSTQVIFVPLRTAEPFPTNLLEQ